MNRLVFATHNANKVEEVRELLSNSFEVLSLDDIGFNDDIIEDKPTIIENSIKKAELIKIKTGFDCFADDTGLEIDSLNGMPGVYSARFAGENSNSQDNIEKVWKLLTIHKNTDARFKSVFSLNLGGKTFFFEFIFKTICV